jgi:acetyl esterase/lipase
MIISTVLLLLIAISALLTVRPDNPVAVVLYWLFAWLGQVFAPQWAILCLVLAGWNLAAHEAAPGSLFTLVGLLLAAGLFLRIYRLGHQTFNDVSAVVGEAITRLGTVAAGSAPGIDAAAAPSPLTGFRPFNFHRTGVVRTKNIPYGAAGRANFLDIYQPRDKAHQPMPVLIHVPGGGWVSGSKDEQALPLLYHMAARGWTCFSINYRLAPKARFPAMLEDVLRAIAWVKSHAADYGANPEFVAITGGSAGGHLVSLAALIRDRGQFQPGFEEVDTRVSVAVPIYGRYDFLNRHSLLAGAGLEPFLTKAVMPGPTASCSELWELASPESQVHAGAPPFLVIHGSADTMIPVEEARHFVTALRQISANPVDYAEVPGAQHGYDMVCSSWAMPTVYAVSRFLSAHYAAHLAAHLQEADAKVLHRKPA